MQSQIHKDFGPIVEVMVNDVRTSALLDTGARHSSVSVRLARRLKLPEIGHRDRSPVYQATVTLQGVTTQLSSVAEEPMCDAFDLVVGRDLLTRYRLTYSGADGVFTLE